MSGKTPDAIDAPMRSRRSLIAALALGAAGLLSACAGDNSNKMGDFNLGEFKNPFAQQPEAQPAASIGSGQVRIGLILPLSGQGNAGVAAQSMKNAAELALAEFKNPDIQLLVKDDAGTPQGAQAAAQEAMNEGAELIIGPLFAQSVRAVAQTVRPRNIPVIAFSTDASVATRGVYLLSFLPETDVRRHDVAERLLGISEELRAIAGGVRS